VIFLAIRQAKVQPTIEEKRYNLIQFLEAAFMQGNEVNLHTVKDYKISKLSGEAFEYNEPINTYIIYHERPKVNLLKTMGWYREDDENKPQIAEIPTWLLKDKQTGEVVNEVLLEADEFQQLVKTGESQNYILEPLEIKRGTLLDIVYDFMPTNVNRFYVTDVHIDTVSINYMALIMPYKYDLDKTTYKDEDADETSWLNFDSSKHRM
jgi:hypothetical protein